MANCEFLKHLLAPLNLEQGLHVIEYERKKEVLERAKQSRLLHTGFELLYKCSKGLQVVNQGGEVVTELEAEFLCLLLSDWPIVDRKLLDGILD